MTSGALNFAVRHAALVEALEECAPPVTATYLQRAYDRMKVGVSVEFKEPSDVYVVWRPWSGYSCEFHDGRSAFADYLDVCDILLGEPLPPSLFSSAHSPHPCADAPTLIGAAAGASPAPAAPISDPVAPTGSLPAAATSLDARSDAASSAFSSQASS